MSSDPTPGQTNGRRPTGAPVGFSNHDHGLCVADAMAEVEARCAAEGLRLTPVRRRVLEILLESHRAMRAYEVLERMQAEGLGAQPPAAYRVLDFLTSNGFAHRIEALNAFVACTHPGEHHVPAFLHCRICDGVVETVTSVGSVQGDSLLDAAAQAAGFRIEARTVEAHGICSICRASEEA